MPATPIYAIPYPAGTDRVMDGDDAMGSIATQVEAVLGSYATWTPGVGQPGPVSFTANYAKYRNLAGTVIGHADLAITSGGTAAALGVSGPPILTTAPLAPELRACGTWWLFVSGTTIKVGTVGFYNSGAGGTVFYFFENSVGNPYSTAVKNGDRLCFSFALPRSA